MAWAVWGLVGVGVLVVVWFDARLRDIGRADLVSISGDAVPYLLAMASAATVGAVLAGRRPRHPVGWLLLGIAVAVIMLGFCDAYAAYGLLARPGSLPGARWAAIYVDVSWAVLSALLGFVLLLTPTGSPPSPRWRWWAWLVAVASVLSVTLHANPLDPPYEAVPVPLLFESGPLAAVARLGDVIVLVGVLVAAGSLVLRFRRAQLRERLQLRWVTAAAALAALAAAVILVTWATIGSAAQPIWELATVAFMAALPLATGASILRYRLYDLDRIISRTLAWTALTILLGLGYAAAVLLLGRLLPDSSSLAVAGATLAVAALPLATGASILRYRLYDLDRIISRTLAWTALTILLGLGYAAAVLLLGLLLPDSSSLAVAGATLAVAATFQPVRRRVQETVDRRFNRRRYDAARTIAAFSARLREEVDLDTLSVELLAVTDQTMQPTTVSLWLRARA